MNLEALRYLACPVCRGDLRVQDGISSGSDVQTGRLECVSGCGSYPIESGVPQLLPELSRRVFSPRAHQNNTKRSFTAQWNLYRYGNTTWGTTVSDRIEVVLHELGWSRSELTGKVILDAGCGNGTLSRALSEQGATVVAIDLSKSVFRAQEHCAAPGLHFVQGNLFFPPLRNGVFDAIYSCGVFHHTPDTRRCFDALVSILTNASHVRYFSWLYSKRSWLFNITVEQMMKVTRRVPSQMLVPMCCGLAPVVELGSRLATALRLVSYAPRNLRDRAVQLHDLLSPAFVSYHTFEEVKGWAVESGFRRVEKTTYRASEGDDDGLARVLDRYRTVCRPGFGVLCGGLHAKKERAR